MITQRRYRREITEARRAYRLEAEQIQARLLTKERQLDAMLAGVARAKTDSYLQPVGGYHQPRIVIDITDPWIMRLDPATPAVIYERLAKRLITSLFELRDRRPDMREADTAAFVLHN